MSQSIKIFLASFILFFGLWLPLNKLNINKLSIQSEDTIPALLLPVVIIKEKTLYLDTYYEFMRDRYPHPDDKDFQKDLVPFYLRRVVEESQDSSIPDSRHYVTAFPLISGLLAVPVYLVPMLVGVPITWGNLAVLGHITGSLIVSVSGVLFYLLLKKHFLDEKKSLLLTYIYLFGTINFALVSQALWQHGAIQLFSILAFYYFLNSLSSKGRKLDIIWFGFYSGVAFLTRPTYILVLGFLGLAIIYKLRFKLKFLFRYAVLFFSGVLPAIIFFLWYNSKYYLSIANQGYADQAGSGWLGRFPEGFLGLWFSPSKGILIYSPILFFAFVGMYLVYKRRDYSKDYAYLVSFGAVILHILVLGKWKHWYGGWSYGYRMASDILPFLVLLLVPFVLSAYYEKYKKAFFIAFGFSVLVQLHGMIFYDGIWHSAYDGGFQNTSWLWSIQDSEVAFNIRRVLVKLGLLDRACPQCLPG